MIMILSLQIMLDDPGIAKHMQTTDEIKACCDDIKVLGKKELRLVLSSVCPVSIAIE